MTSTGQGDTNEENISLDERSKFNISIWLHFDRKNNLVSRHQFNKQLFESTEIERWSSRLSLLFFSVE